MSTPRFSHPSILTRAQLAGNPTLTAQLTDFINVAFIRPKTRFPDTWDLDAKRFRPESTLMDMLGDNGILSLIYDDNEEREQDHGVEKRVVACGAAIPWNGGWHGEGKGKEEGWEVKIVCADGDAKYARTGLAVKVVAHLEHHLVQRRLEEEKENQEDVTVEDGTKRAEERSLTLWLIAAECVNGVYWRKRGFTDVRKSVVEPPTWGSKKSFVIAVMRKDVMF